MTPLFTFFLISIRLRTEKASCIDYNERFGSLGVTFEEKLACKNSKIPSGKSADESIPF